MKLMKVILMELFGVWCLSNIAVEPRPLGRGYKALIFSLHDPLDMIS